VQKVPTFYAIVDKGYFPHFFNTTENQNYIGKIPDTKYHGVNSMKIKERQVFLEWHNLKKDKYSH
jgi:hypothetical protein